MPATIGELYRQTVADSDTLMADRAKLEIDATTAAGDEQLLLGAMRSRAKPGFVAYPEGQVSVLSLSPDGNALVIQVFESIEDVPLPG